MHIKKSQTSYNKVSTLRDAPLGCYQIRCDEGEADNTCQPKVVVKQDLKANGRR